MNERGSTSFFGICLLMMFSIIALSIFTTQLNQTKILQSKRAILLCTKALNGETKLFIKKIEGINTVLKLLKLGKVGALLIPGINLTTAQGVEYGIKTMKAIQEVHKVSYLKNIQSLMGKSCLFSLNSFKTPYKLKVNTLFERNFYEQTIIRRKKWTVRTINANYSILNEYSVYPFHISSKMKKEFILSNLLSSQQLYL